MIIKRFDMIIIKNWLNDAGKIVAAEATCGTLVTCLYDLAYFKSVASGEIPGRLTRSDFSSADDSKFEGVLDALKNAWDLCEVQKDNADAFRQMMNSLEPVGE